MKTKPSKNSVADAIERTVDDLSQQDVMPPDEGDPAISSDDPLLREGEQVGRWEEPAADLGHQANRVPLEDETKAAEVLVQRGVNEAADELEELQEDETPPEEKETA